MKNTILFFMLVLIGTACKKTNINKLEGKWTLIEVSCECYDPDFDSTAHVWDFNTDDNEVVVTNAVVNNLQILSAGAYSIELTDDKIKIESVNYDYYFENGFLIIEDQPELDGPLLKFKR